MWRLSFVVVILAQATAAHAQSCLSQGDAGRTKCMAGVLYRCVCSQIVGSSICSWNNAATGCSLISFRQNVRDPQKSDAVPLETASWESRSADHEAAALPIPPGATAAQVALGDRLFHGRAGNGACAGCHGSEGAGTPVGPSLRTGKWLWGDGSLGAIARTIDEGVPRPKLYREPMPPLGGSDLSHPETVAVAAYVWAIGHAKR